MRIFIAFLVLTALLTAALLYTYYNRRTIMMYEGFTEEDVSTAEKAVREALPQMDQATISRVITLIQRLSAKVLNPTFFTDAMRVSRMSPMDLAREYIQSQKPKS
jgi:hypothetical protein